MHKRWRDPELRASMKLTILAVVGLLMMFGFYYFW